MSVLTKPYWNNIFGEPMRGFPNVRIVMRSGEMNDVRRSQINQLYQGFHAARATSVTFDQVRNYQLFDGTQVRIQSIQGNDTISVWAIDRVEELPPIYEGGFSLRPIDSAGGYGYELRPGSDPESKRRADYRALMRDHLPSGHAYLDGKGGDIQVPDHRRGFHNMWRPAADDLANTVLFQMDRIQFRGRTIQLKWADSENDVRIIGAAIAESGGEKWLVIVDSARIQEWGDTVAAVPLKALLSEEDVVVDLIDCGAFTEQQQGMRATGVWRFSPDGLKLITLVEEQLIDPWGDRTPRNFIVRGELEPTGLSSADGAAPFSVSFVVEKITDTANVIVTNTFKPREATREFEWLGWEDFGATIWRTYYAVTPYSFSLGTTPIWEFTELNTGQDSDVREEIGRFLDAIDWSPPDELSTVGASSSVEEPFGGYEYIQHWSGGAMSEEEHFRGFALSPYIEELTPSDFIADDGDLPEQITLERSSYDGYLPANRFPGVVYRTGLANGSEMWLMGNKNVLESLHTPAVISTTERSTERIYSQFRQGYVSMGVLRGEDRGQRTGAIREYRSPTGVGMHPDIGSLEAAINARWGQYYEGPIKFDSQSRIFDNTENQMGEFERLIDAARYLDRTMPRGGMSPDAIPKTVIWPTPGSGARGYVPGSTGDYYDIPDVVAVTNGYVEFGVSSTPSELWLDRDESPETALSVFRSSAETIRNSPASHPMLTITGLIDATPVYNNHYITDWEFTSRVHIEGRTLIDAGYNFLGEEQFVYFQGDTSRAINYSSTVTADRAPQVERSTRLSGALGFNLMAGEEVVAQTHVAASDSTSGPLVDSWEFWWQTGQNARFDVRDLLILDANASLGHVLYRQVDEVFAVGGSVTDRYPPLFEGGQEGTLLPIPTSYSLSLQDYLSTPSRTYTLGNKRDVTPPNDQIVRDVREFSRPTSSMLAVVSPHFSPDPQCRIEGETFWEFSRSGGSSNQLQVFQDSLLRLLPEEQHNATTETWLWDRYWNDHNHDAEWARRGMFAFFGRPERRASCNTRAGMRDVIAPTQSFGRLDWPRPGQPTVSATLSAYSDDKWLVCFTTDVFPLESDDNLARFYVKTPSKEGEDGGAKEYLIEETLPFLLAPSKGINLCGFHITRKQ